MTEHDIAAMLPATWVNRFAITVGETVRIGFIEQTEQLQVGRAAVIMSRADAKELATALIKILEGATQ